MAVFTTQFPKLFTNAQVTALTNATAPLAPFFKPGDFASDLVSGHAPLSSSARRGSGGTADFAAGDSHAARSVVRRIG